MFNVIRDWSFMVVGIIYYNCVIHYLIYSTGYYQFTETSINIGQAELNNIKIVLSVK